MKERLPVSVVVFIQSYINDQLKLAQSNLIFQSDK